MLKIERKIFFSMEEWTKVASSATPEQRQVLNDVLSKEIISELTWKDWKTSSKNIETIWPFVKSCLKVRDVWTKPESQKTLFGTADATTGSLDGRADEIYKTIRSTDVGERIAKVQFEDVRMECFQPLIKQLITDDAKAQGTGIMAMLKLLTSAEKIKQYVQDDTGELSNEIAGPKMVFPLNAEMYVDKTINVMIIVWGGKVVSVFFHTNFKRLFQELLEKYKGREGEFGYFRGASKKYGRMSQKLAEYEDVGFPRVGKILDPVRATICFETIDEILVAMELIEGADFCKIVRIKNKYADGTDFSFRCVMINVLVEAHGIQVIGEIQLTTVESLKLKKLQHKIYKIRRAFGENYGDRTPEEVFTAILKDVCKVTAT